MPHWPTPDTPAHVRAKDQFVADFGADCSYVTEAPSTAPIVGEYVDHYGGAVVLGLAAPRVAVAIAPNSDNTIDVRLHRIRDTESQSTITDAVTVDEVAQVAADAVNADDAESTDRDDTHSSVALRLGGIAHTLIHRQLVPRDTAGLNVTIVSDVPKGPALGEDEAIDAAFALALLAEAPDAHEAPMRARLAEVCAQSAEVFSPRPLTRARYSAALRGEAGSLAVIDYADGSVMQAPAPPVPAFALLVPKSEPADDGEKRRRKFFDDACRAFGTDSLRSLPDARTRVLDWLRAVHTVHPDTDAPEAPEAARWLSYVEKETARALKVALALRSRRVNEVWPQLLSSQAETAAITGADDALVRLASSRGALSARAAGAAGATGAVAFVPENRVNNFAADFAEDGLLVVALGTGRVAEICS